MHWLLRVHRLCTWLLHLLWLHHWLLSHAVSWCWSSISAHWLLHHIRVLVAHRLLTHWLLTHRLLHHVGILITHWGLLHWLLWVHTWLLHWLHSGLLWLLGIHSWLLLLHHIGVLVLSHWLLHTHVHIHRSRCLLNLSIGDVVNDLVWLLVISILFDSFKLLGKLLFLLFFAIAVITNATKDKEHKNESSNCSTASVT